MKLTRKDVRGVVVVAIQGNIIGGSGDSEKFHEMFKSIIDEGKRDVVIDLGRTSYANSLGIGMIIGVYTSLKKAGGELVLARVIDRVKGILAVTQLLLIFKTFETVEAAVDYLLEKTGDRQDGESPRIPT